MACIAISLASMTVSARPPDPRDHRHARRSAGRRAGSGRRARSARAPAGVGAGLDQMGEALVIADGRRCGRDAGWAASRNAASSAGSPEPSKASCALRSSKNGRQASSRSRPFCQVSRLTTPNSSASGVAGEAEPACSAALLSARAGELVRGKGRGDQRVGFRVPDLRVDAVEDAGDVVRRARSRPSRPMPANGLAGSPAHRSARPW